MTLHKVFTIMEKAPTRAFSSIKAPTIFVDVDKCRGFLRDCENFAKVRCQLYPVDEHCAGRLVVRSTHHHQGVEDGGVGTAETCNRGSEPRGFVLLRVQDA